MTAPAPPSRSLADTRETLHRVCAHVLARRRRDVSGRFGLRAGPAGIATPAFGEEPEVLRIAGTVLVRESGGESTRTPLCGSTLRELGRFAHVDLGTAFSAGTDTPVLGDVDESLDLPAQETAVISGWFALAWDVLDGVLDSLPSGSTGTTIQLWPEHFDAATTVTLGSSARVNLGFSPGDGFEAEPYVYIGPWGEERPADPSFWNAPFGATFCRSQLLGEADPAASCRAFIDRGLQLLS